MGRGQKCPYSCLDSFLPLLVFSFVLHKVNRGLQKASTIFSCPEVVTFALGIDPTISVSADVFSHVCRAVWH